MTYNKIMTVKNELKAEVAIRKTDKVMFHVILLKNGLVRLIGQDGKITEETTKAFDFYTYVNRKKVYVN